MDALEAHLIRLKNDRPFRQRMEAILDLARDSHDSEKSEETLCLYAYVTVTRKPGSTSKKAWQQCWSRNTGKTWKALSEFPDRIRKISAEVKRVHGSPYFDPGRAIRGQLAGWADFWSHAFSGADDEFVDSAKRQFAMFPVILNLYADWLDVQIKGTSALMRHTSALMRHFYLGASRKHPRFIHEVSKEVRRITGRFCDHQVADLLNAADRVVNPHNQGSSDRFDEQTIALLRSRQKRKRSDT